MISVQEAVTIARWESGNMADPCSVEYMLAASVPGSFNLATAISPFSNPLSFLQKSDLNRRDRHIQR